MDLCKHRRSLLTAAASTSIGSSAKISTKIAFQTAVEIPVWTSDRVPVQLSAWIPIEIPVEVSAEDSITPPLGSQRRRL